MSGGEVQCELLIGSRVSYFLITVATLSRGGAGCRDYRDHLSKFDIFYQNHFFPVQKLLIDLLLLSLSIAITAGVKYSVSGSAKIKWKTYLLNVNVSGCERGKCRWWMLSATSGLGSPPH